MIRQDQKGRGRCRTSPLPRLQLTMSKLNANFLSIGFAGRATGLIGNALVCTVTGGSETTLM